MASACSWCVDLMVDTDQHAQLLGARRPRPDEQVLDEIPLPVGEAACAGPALCQLLAPVGWPGRLWRHRRLDEGQLDHVAPANAVLLQQLGGQLSGDSALARE